MPCDSAIARRGPGRVPQVRRPRLRRDAETWWAVGATLTGLAALAVSALALVLHYVATPWQLTIALTAFGHYLMWAAPIAAALAVAVRRWLLSAFALSATALVLMIQVPSNVAANHDAPGRRIVVLQANLAVGSADPEALIRLVRDRHADVLATEELTVAEQQHLIAAGLARALPYHFTAPLASGGGGLGIWSRYPLSQRANVPHYRLGVLHARVALPNGIEPTFVAVHLVPPYPHPAGIWRAEIGRLRGALGALPRYDPVLVAGDFNATPDDARYRALLDHGYTDAADDAGAGYLATYPNDRWYGPLLAIDHVLMRGAVYAGAVDSLELAGSDHRALVARLTLTSPSL